MIPGELFLGEGRIVCNRGRTSISVRVRNSSGHVIFASSHYHFFEVNRRLVFDREAAYGMRLDIPAGETVLWRPGETKEVRLIPYTGEGRVMGFNGLVNDVISSERKKGALERARSKGFLSGGTA